MSESLACFILAGLMLFMVFITPHVLSLRIRIFRWLRLKWLADWHDRNRKPIIAAVRVLLSVVAVVLLVHGLGSLS